MPVLWSLLQSAPVTANEASGVLDLDPASDADSHLHQLQTRLSPQLHGDVLVKLALRRPAPPPRLSQSLQPPPSLTAAPVPPLTPAQRRSILAATSTRADLHASQAQLTALVAQKAQRFRHLQQAMRLGLLKHTTEAAKNVPALSATSGCLAALHNRPAWRGVIPVAALESRQCITERTMAQVKLTRGAQNEGVQHEHARLQEELRRRREAEQLARLAALKANDIDGGSSL